MPRECARHHANTINAKTNRDQNETKKQTVVVRRGISRRSTAPENNKHNTRRARINRVASLYLNHEG